MKWPIIFIVLISSISLQAQNCLYRVNSVSGMDGTRLVITEPIELTNNFENGTLEAWTTIYGDTALVLAFVIHSPDMIPLVKGDEIILLNADGEAITLNIYQDPVKAQSNAMKLTCLTVLSPENIAALENSIITKIQFQGEQYQQEGIIKKKKSTEAIGKLIGCIKKYLR
jgi:hypothetical protein